MRGRRFLHPKLGITFTAPPEFTLDNTAQAVLGMRDGGDQALRLDVVRVPEAQSLTDYLTSGWIENVDTRTVETLDINGSPAATATAKGEQWTFRLYVLRHGGDIYRFVFALETAATANAPSANRSAPSAASAPRRSRRRARCGLQTVMVQAGDTTERFAARMATDRPLERFLVLNGLTQASRSRLATSVKIVVE